VCIKFSIVILMGIEPSFTDTDEGGECWKYSIRVGIFLHDQNHWSY
jgi:hypothetical protein